MRIIEKLWHPTCKMISMKLIILSLYLGTFLLTSCAKQTIATGTLPLQATIVMKDGTRLSGTVQASNPSEMTVVGNDNIPRTVAIGQIKSINYNDTAQLAPTQRSGVVPSKSVAYESFHEDHYHAPPKAVTSKTNELEVGTQVTVRTEETIDSSRATEGQTFAAEVTQDVRDRQGDLVIPAGSNAIIVIQSVTKGGRFKGTSDLVLDMKSVSVDGQSYRIDTASLDRRGKNGFGANKRTAEFTGGGAAVGAIIGAIAGQGRGAAIGAGAGAGAGALTQIITKGGAIRVPVESLLTFRLDRPLRVIAHR